MIRGHRINTGRGRLHALVFLLGFLGWAVPGHGLSADGGTNNPFEYGAGSRALAMGRAYVALANDASAVFWNPAGLAQLDQIEVTAMHIPLFFNTSYDYVGLAYPILDWGIFAVGALRLGTDGVVVRDDQARLSSGPTGTLDMREYLVSYSHQLPYGLAAGLTLRVDQQRLLGDEAIGSGLDVGLHYRFPRAAWGGIPWEHLTFGLMLQNIVSSRLKLKDATDTLPLNIKSGLAFEQHFKGPTKQQLVVSCMWEKSTWREAQMAVGVEYGLFNMVFIRGGWNSEAWTVGGGAHYQGLLLDYALSAEPLGLVHRVTLSYRFGKPLSLQQQERDQHQQELVDQRASKQAQAAKKQAQEAIERNQAEMEKQLNSAQRRYQRERRRLLSRQRRRLAAERAKALSQRKTAVADEYFKALHYFEGISDYLAKNYKSAMVEFDTVSKYDPNYLELKLYIGKTKQMMDGGVALSPANMKLYYQGIDLYIDEKFEEAIAIWQKILKTDPNNILVNRNIQEAKDRLARLKDTSGSTEP